ncbi:MAG: hypothetical protein QM756_35430 [Polyangiaceae bacterium]
MKCSVTRSLHGLTWLFLAASCGGKSLHLDAGSGAPDAGGMAGAGGAVSEVVAAKQLTVTELAVDGTRLYWLSEGGVHSCSKESCANTLVDYELWPEHPGQGVPSGPHDARLAVSEGNVYWERCVNIPDSFYEIATCASSGCAGPPRVVAGLGWGWMQSFAADAENVFWSNISTIYSCPVSGCAAPVLFTSDSMEIRTIALDQEYVYWIARTGGGAGGVVRRMPKDGSSAPVDSRQFPQPS